MKFLFTLFVIALLVLPVIGFVDGRFCGQGFGKYPNGDMFVGDWKDNAKHGEGMIYFEDGS